MYLNKLQKIRLATYLLVACLGSAGLGGCTGQPLSELDGQLREQMGQVEFDSGGQPGQPFLVVLVVVTKDDAVMQETGFELILGQPKANSTTADLRIVSTASGTNVAQYQVADPRFSKVQDRRWNEAESATMHVFIPLSVHIDLVSIKPVPGRESVVSGGGSFDPRPLMLQACEQIADTELEIHFPQCPGVVSLLTE